MPPSSPVTDLVLLIASSVAAVDNTVAVSATCEVTASDIWVRLVVPALPTELSVVLFLLSIKGCLAVNKAKHIYQPITKSKYSAYRTSLFQRLV